MGAGSLALQSPNPIPQPPTPVLKAHWVFRQIPSCDTPCHTVVLYYLYSNPI